MEYHKNIAQIGSKSIFEKKVLKKIELV